MFDTINQRLGKPKWLSPILSPSLKTQEWIAAYIFLTPFLIFFLIFVVRAVIASVGYSFLDWRLLRPTTPYIGLENYTELFKDPIWWDSVKNTIYFTIMTVVGSTVVALVAALAVTRPIKGQQVFRVILYIPQLMSVGAVGLIWVWLLSTQFGVINYFLSFLGIHPINWLGDPNLVLPALSLTTIWWTFGFPMLIFIAGLQGIPDHLYEAARIDGGNGWQIFLYITLPLLRPTLLFVTVTGRYRSFSGLRAALHHHGRRRTGTRIVDGHHLSVQPSLDRFPYGLRFGCGGGYRAHHGRDYDLPIPHYRPPRRVLVGDLELWNL